MRIVATAMLIILATVAARADATEDGACSVAANMGGDTQALIDQIASMATAWPAEEKSRLGPALLEQLSGKSLSPGELYLIADLGSFVREYLVITHDGGELGNVYFRLLFEREADGLEFKTIRMHTKFHEVAGSGVMMPPVRVECP